MWGGLSKQLKGGVSLNCIREERPWSRFMGDEEELSSGQLHGI